MMGTPFEKKNNVIFFLKIYFVFTLHSFDFFCCFRFETKSFCFHFAFSFLFIFFSVVVLSLHFIKKKNL